MATSNPKSRKMFTFQGYSWQPQIPSHEQFSLSRGYSWQPQIQSLEQFSFSGGGSYSWQAQIQSLEQFYYFHFQWVGILGKLKSKVLNNFHFWKGVFLARSNAKSWTIFISGGGGALVARISLHTLLGGGEYLVKGRWCTWSWGESGGGSTWSRGGGVPGPGGSTWSWGVPGLVGVPGLGV